MDLWRSPQKYLSIEGGSEIKTLKANGGANEKKDVPKEQ